jgi:hypothetical protein
VGIAGAAIPLIAGVAAAFAAPRRRPEDDDLPPGVLPPLRIAVPLGLTAAGALVAWVGIEVARAPIPGRPLAVDDPLWDVLDAVESLREAQGTDETLARCHRLGALIDAGSARQATERSLGDRALGAAPDLRALGTQCVPLTLRKAMAKPLDQALGELEALTKSFFVKSDPVLEQLVQETILRLPPQRAPERPPVEVTIGEILVSSPLPDEQRAELHREIGRLSSMCRGCYTGSDTSYEGTSGEVRVRIVIDASGRIKQVSDEGSSFEDTALRACVRGVLGGVRASATAKGASVVVPVRFTVPQEAER